MGIRSTVGSMLESAIGRERTNRIRQAERRARNALAKRLVMEEPTKPVVRTGRSQVQTNCEAVSLAACGSVRTSSGADDDPP
jgi:hypothetical protein